MSAPSTSPGYTLAGRAVADTVLEWPIAPCVFCGEAICHLDADDDVGDRAQHRGYYAQLRTKDGTEIFLYCVRPACRKDYGAVIWACGTCNIDVIGDRCPDCHQLRAEADRYRPGGEYDQESAA